jgi:crossover junction endodeoxyribonuclease RusA
MGNLDLILPFPPTVNSYYLVVGGTRRGVKRISKAGRDFRVKIEEEVVEQIGQAPLLHSRFALRVILYPPDQRIRDLDNYMKALLDALTQARVWEDDSLIDQLLIYRGVVTQGGKTRILISDAGPILPDVNNALDFIYP